MRRNDLYFTPMMMVDGKYPFLGSNRDKAVSSIRQAKNEPAGVSLNLKLEGTGAKKTLTLKVAARAAGVAGRDVLIGVAMTEDQVTTKVPSGENAGKTLVEHHVARRLDHKFTKLDRTGEKSLTFPIELPAGANPANFHVAVFAQDRASGVVYQAEAIPWTPPVAIKAQRTHPPERTVTHRKPRRGAPPWISTIPGFSAMMPTQSPDTDSDETIFFCPVCGSIPNPPPRRSVEDRAIPDETFFHRLLSRLKSPACPGLDPPGGCWF